MISDRKLIFANKEIAMSLQIQFECPQCNQTLAVNLNDYAPGRRQICETCQTPARVTEAGLERFSEDLQLFCLG